MSRSRRFSKGVGHFERKFQTEGASPTNRFEKRRLRQISAYNVSNGPQMLARNVTLQLKV